MDHKEIRGRLNKELAGKAQAISLKPEKGKRITSGLSSGSMLLNMAMSGSPLVGYAWGRIAEIYGPESTGKTTLALHAIYEAQRLEKASKQPIPCLFVDAEHALDPVYAQNIGVDVALLDIVQPDCGEDALESVEKAVEVGYKLIAIDSVAALTPRAEIEGEMGDSHMGLQARLMSQACRKLSGKCGKAGAIILFVNQIRMKIGLVFGNPETTTGGMALKFYSTYRLEIRAPRKGAKKGTLAGMGESVEIGTNVKVKVNKNKVYPPHRTASFYIEYGKGIDRYKDAIDFLLLVDAFRPAKSGKGKVLSLSSKGKAYSAGKVLGFFRTDSKVQHDILTMVHKIDEEML